MSDLNKETIKQLTRLCRIHCTEEEQDSILKDLKKIVTYIEQLKEIDTDNVPPCNQVLSDYGNVMREDEIGPVLDRDTVLKNAPEHIAGLFRVPKIMKNN